MRGAAAALLSILLVACGSAGRGGGTASPPPTVRAGGESEPVGPLRDAAVALCTARDQARAGDVNAARTTFYDRSHDALHALARLLGTDQRATAAQLLEAKNRVESDFTSERPPPDVAGDLDQLARVTRAGLASLSIAVPACP